MKPRFGKKAPAAKSPPSQAPNSAYIRPMKMRPIYVIPLFALAVSLSAPMLARAQAAVGADVVLAQDQCDGPQGLLDWGARRLFDHFLGELGSGDLTFNGQPVDLDHYSAPEMLPNGDIILRRKTDAAPDEPTVDL